MKVLEPVPGRTLRGHTSDAEIRELGLNFTFLYATAISDKIIRFKNQMYALYRVSA